MSEVEDKAVLMAVAKDVDDEVARYFRALGFQVTWDFKRTTGLHWYEIYDEDKLLVQIDFGPPLSTLKQVLPMFAKGKPDTTTEYQKGWGLRCDDDAKLKLIVNRMRAFEGN